MRRLNSVLGQEMMYQPYMAQGSDTATGQNMGLLTRIDPVQALRTTNSREAYPVQVRSSMLFMCIHPPIVTCMVGELQGSTCGSHETGYSGCSKHFGALFRIQGACVRVLHSLVAFQLNYRMPDCLHRRRVVGGCCALVGRLIQSSEVPPTRSSSYRNPKLCDGTRH